VLSNRTNLARETLHIYSDPACTEDPAPIRFVDPGLVTDLPDAPLLLPLRTDVGLVNFEIARSAVLADIGAFLDGLIGTTTR
jgi:hypothetical protein